MGDERGQQHDEPNYVRHQVSPDLHNVPDVVLGRYDDPLRNVLRGQENHQLRRIDEEGPVIEVESLVLFVEDVITYVLRYYNFNWHPSPHFYKERFYKNRGRFFCRRIGDAAVHHCLSDRSVFMAESLGFEFENWFQRSDHRAGIYVRILLEMFQSLVPMTTDLRALRFISLAGVLSVRAMERNKINLVNIVVREAVNIMQTHYCFESYYLNFKKRSKQYIRLHACLHSLSEDDGLGNEVQDDDFL